MQPTPVFLPGESRGQRSLADYSPWGRKELDVTEHADVGETQAAEKWPGLSCTGKQMLPWLQSGRGPAPHRPQHESRGGVPGRTEAPSHLTATQTEAALIREEGSQLKPTGSRQTQNVEHSMGGSFIKMIHPGLRDLSNSPG